MLSTKELTDMQEESNRSQPSPCQILRPSFAADAWGGETTVETVVATTTCRLSPVGQVRGQQAVIGGVIGDRAGWVINVPVNTDVESRDVVDVTGFGRYLVQQVVRRSVATAIVLYCQEDL